MFVSKFSFEDVKGNLENDPNLGPKLRPLCPANVAPNSNLGNLMARMTKVITDEAQDRINTEVISTEELKFHLEKVNVSIQERVRNYKNSLASRTRRCDTRPPKQDLSDTIVLSMDVTALYPSISKELAKKSIMKTMKSSKVPWSDINVRQLARYIVVISNDKEIKDNDLKERTPTAKPRTTLNSFTNPTKRSRATNGDNQFTDAPAEPNDKQIRSMLALALAKGVEVAMTNHYYTFGGQIRKQITGGAIGAELTGEVSRDVMTIWDQRFLERARSLGLKLEIYKRYVDDDLIVL